MSTALIGYSGLVGSHLAEQHHFEEHYNSANIGDICGREFDLVVCAGVSAVKWWSNQHPEQDQAGIDKLVECLLTVSARRFVLVSTVDVYPDPVEVDEDSPIKTEDLQAYGRNRRLLELRIAARFPQLHTVRLPGLFGKRLKKNVLFDMLSSKMLDKVNPENVFQWYPLSRIWADIDRVVAADVRTCNLAVEPVATACIQRRFFPQVRLGGSSSALVRYDMRTRHAALFHQAGHYAVSAEEALHAMRSWLEEPMVSYG